MEKNPLLPPEVKTFFGAIFRCAAQTAEDNHAKENKLRDMTIAIPDADLTHNKE